ncbi:beta-galactosidase [Xylanimonas sp. McL0601]|uniref:beta-galactosidase n=1 Tax=Xylanimonas sp. McL0601 TaxID=3414739 RepID=UPI003CE838A5
MTVGLSTSGLVIDGQEQLRLCASLFYFRLPREVWAARLAAVRASGYDLVDVYLPWNFHEVAPGRWDFSGRRDVGAFLDLAHEAGLGVIARPGPYICSEWDGGGLPAWLGLEEGLQLRQAEPRYLTGVEQWFERALPLLAQREHGRGGAVVAVQLENELDFFDTADRAAYVGHLRDLAIQHGITVPLVACAGQGDLTGATGGVAGVFPAANFYPDDRSPDIEPEVRRYADLLAESGQPLLVTETNRQHATLRRLLVSGAKVIAPYLQASGFDLGWTPSVGNWGNPGGFMAHDYDFGGYIDPVGAVRPEHAEARVLSAVLRTLGAALARAVTEAADGAFRTTAATTSSPSRLLLDGGGSLLGVPNLTGKPGAVTLPQADGVPEVTVPLPAASCLLVLRDLPLDRFGLVGTLRLATADLVGAGPDGLVLSARAASVVVLQSPDGDPVLVELVEPAAGSPVKANVVSGDVAWDVVVLHPDDVGEAPRGTPARFDDGAITVVVDDAVRLDLSTRTPRTTPHELAPASEAVGVHRGRTHYRADLAGVHELVLEGAADIVDLTLDDEVRPTLVPFGASVVVPTGGAQRLEATVETWGHANFDDARLPALRLGSLRGLGRVWSVVAREDVTALWSVEAGEAGEAGAAGRAGAGWPGRPAPMRGLAGWSSTRIGEPVTYRRSLPVAVGHHHALRWQGVEGSVRVTVDGHPGVVTREDPWVHLAPGEGSDVAVTMPHRPGASLRAELFRLEPVRGWEVEAQPDHAIDLLSTQHAPGTAVRLPLALKPGEETWLDVVVPAGGLSLRFEGRQVRVAAFAHGELLGRVWLEDAQRPRFTGGDPGRLWLPRAWNDATLRLLVRATVSDESPILGGVQVTAVQE